MTRTLSRRLFLGSVAALAAGAVMATGQPAKALETTDVTIGTARDPNLGALIIITNEKGFFEEAGLNVNISFFPSGGDLAAAVVGGSILIGSSGSTPTTTLRGSPFPINILARQADISGAQQIIVKPDDISRPEDMHGKRIGYLPGTASEGLLNGFIDTYGVDRDRLRLISMGPTEMVTSFARGDVDAVALWEAHATRARVAGNGKVLHSGTTSYIPGMEGPERIYGDHSTLFATERFINDNPQTVRAILGALERGTRFIETDFEEASVILAGVLNTEVDEMREIMGVNRYTLQLDDEMVGDLDRLAGFLEARGRLDQRLHPLEWINPEPLRDVNPDLVRLSN